MFKRWLGALGILASLVVLECSEAPTSEVLDPQLSRNAASVVGKTVVASADSLSLVVPDTATLTAYVVNRGRIQKGGGIEFHSLNSAVAKVTLTGVVTAVDSGSTHILATAGGSTPDSVLVRVVKELEPPPVDTVRIVQATPDTLTLIHPQTFPVSAQVVNSKGETMPLAVVFTSRDTSIVNVGEQGMVSSVAEGSTLIDVRAQGAVADSVLVMIQDTTTDPPPPPPPPVNLEGIQFILGPQIPAGTSRWPQYDNMLLANAQRHHDNFMLNGNSETYYYDLGLVLWIAYQRTGDPRYQQMARNVMDKRIEQMVGWTDPGVSPTFVYSSAPRGVALGSMMIRALDGRWNDTITFDNGVKMTLGQWIEGYDRHQYRTWLGLRIGNASLHYGIRDGGYMLLYTAQLAKIHPDPVVRAELTQMVLVAGRDYYARLQYPDGGWYWNDGDQGAYLSDGVTRAKHSQPFMVGLLLDGMVAAHQVTNDPTIFASIEKGAQWLADVYRTDSVYVAGSWNQWIKWRGQFYFIFEPATDSTKSTKEFHRDDDGRLTSNGPFQLDGGWDTNTIREVRQMVPESMHVYGYLYYVSGDTKWLAYGDEQMASSFGRGMGPLADRSYALCDYQGKQYNQCYRSSGKYEGFIRLR